MQGLSQVAGWVQRERWGVGIVIGIDTHRCADLRRLLVVDGSAGTQRSGCARCCRFREDNRLCVSSIEIRKGKPIEAGSVCHTGAAQAAVPHQSGM